MGTKTFSLPEKVIERLKKEGNQSELINSLLTKHFRATEEQVSPENPNGMKRYELNRCDLCGDTENIYFCEKAHGRNFCKPCLVATNRMNGNNMKFIARCKDMDCDFIPFVSKDESIK